MKNNDYCSGCSQKDTCRTAYKKLGNAQGPNVAMRVIVAFLVPIGVFIAALVGGERLLESRLEGKVLTLVSFLLAVGLTLLALYVIRAIRSPFRTEHKNKR